MYRLFPPVPPQPCDPVPSLKSKPRRHRRKSQPDRQFLQGSAAPPTAVSLTSSPVLLQASRGTEAGFVLNPYHRIEISPTAVGFATALPWSSVLRLTHLTESPPICPICQYCPPALPYAGPCGHPHCLMCLFSLISALGKCSVCGVSLYIRDLRPVQFLPISAIRPGSEASFTLLTRPKAGLGGVYKACEGRGKETGGLPKAVFRRFNRVTIYQEDGDCTALEQAIEATDQEPVKTMLRTIMGNLPEVRENRAENKAEKAINSALFYYFYQSADGQPYFLSTLTDQLLLSEFHYRTDFPPELNCPVLGIEAVILTTEILKEFRFLRYFAVGETAYLVDLDLSLVCSKAVLDSFSSELEACEFQRKSKARKEAVALALGKQLREPLACPLSAMTR